MTTMTLERPGPRLLDAPRGRPWREALAGRAVTVVGLARSGIAACRLLQAVGARWDTLLTETVRRRTRSGSR